MSDLLELAERVDAMKYPDNSVDVLVEIALFEPDELFTSVRSNSAGTKVIYTTANGRSGSFWAQDWTIDSRREQAAASLRARAAAPPPPTLEGDM